MFALIIHYYFDPPITAEGTTDVQDFYLQITKYTLKYTGINNQIIDVDFAELWQYYQLSFPLPEAYGGDPKAPGYNDEWKNKLNLSQLTMVKSSSRIDSSKAVETLDTNIFELLPNQNQRQLQIDNFFDLFNPDKFLFGRSICVGSPLTTILEFSPILVKNIFICVSVAF